MNQTELGQRSQTVSILGRRAASKAANVGLTKLSGKSHDAAVVVCSWSDKVLVGKGCSIAARAASICSSSVIGVVVSFGSFI